MTDSSVGRMEKEEEDLVSGTFTWRIDNFSTLNKQKHYSDVFVVGGYKWRILIIPKGNNVDCLSVYLDAADASTLPSGSTRYAKFSLTLVNQLDSKKSMTEDTEHEFVANDNDWGFPSFILLSELCDHDKGYLVNDFCVVEVKVSVRNGIKILEDQETGELIDFRGLGRVEKTFVPFLEEVCSSYPSLLECHKKRSRTFIQCAFTALGRLLRFLKTTKAKDMTRDACKRLQLLWEELETFKFDLVWLEPHVQSVLVMKKRAGRVDRLREDVEILENEIKRRRDVLAAAEVDLEAAKRDLAKAEEFKKIDMDTELGYPLT
ncbi:MATH domain and coiled-coil domain-containing protein [Prunus yedoensis var. nudiflora]|uniref:MATH domain and coiled-coil domain-containing protein n=1 Tax=Prunus yedoensis var. nudiflora TaxID=2094558 RepID=A0A314Z169_PRUYE|nr:MATH domain and coiled-coil domain-containing protein [Prunus yedoensis var. nudiflora]